jgi:LacI family transcriptional regulator
VGLFVCSDQFAPDLASACVVAGLRIPDDVAIVGVDNDPAFCEVIQPSLSSVDANHGEIGYVAASLLDRILKGASTQRKEYRIVPHGVEIRQSSDVYAISDEGVKKALLAIREDACQGISVNEIAQRAGYSRSVLQRRFRSLLGQTVHDAIVGTRLSRAKELLTLTRLPLLEVAVRSGFNYQEYLNQVFKERVGMTPGEYRKRFTSARH